MINIENLLFYDVEVYKHDALIVFCDYQGQEVQHFWSRRDGTFPNRELIAFLSQEKKNLVGYNNYYYDDKILRFMVEDNPETFSTLKACTVERLKEVNDNLIKGTEDYRKELLYTRSRIFKDRDIVSYDCFQQIDVSRPSLKYLEGNMGMSIEETEISFDRPEPLTDEERELVHKYCLHDVRATIEVFKKRKNNYFDVKEELIELVNNQNSSKEKMIYWGTNTISANVIMPLNVNNKAARNMDGRLNINDYIDDSIFQRFSKQGEDFDKIVEYWKNWTPFSKDKLPSYIGKNQFGCDLVYGLGGLHGVPADKINSFQGDILLSDVASMYPSMIILLHALFKDAKKMGNNEWDPVKHYDDLRKERISIKKTNKTKADALKLVLNSVYGNLKYENSLLYHPIASTSICAYGQMALTDLAKGLYEAGYKLINLNTDGIAFLNTGYDYETVEKEWMERWGMLLETEHFKKWIQKDVNNYIAVRPDGSVKTKGGECNKYASDQFFKNNSLRILHIGLVEKILNPELNERDIVENHLDDPKLFQYILRAGHTFAGVFDKETRTKYQDVNRIIAVKSKYAEPMIYKVRQGCINSPEYKGWVCFPDIPEHMKVVNGDVTEIPNFKDILDKEYYAELIRRKVRQWGILI